MSKHFKLVCVVMILMILLFMFSACSNKSQEKLDKAELLLSEISYELGKIVDDCEIAMKFGDYDSLEEEVGITKVRCEDLKDKIDEALLFGYR